MSEIEIKFRVSFGSKKNSESFSSYLDGLPKENLLEYNVEVEKNNVSFSALGPIFEGYEQIVEIYRYAKELNCNKFSGYSFNNQVASFEYFCFYRKQDVLYREGENPYIQKKLDKAYLKGNLLDVLERMLARNQLVSPELQLDEIIEEYVKTSKFKESYLNFKPLERGRNKAGDTLLTAMIKSGNHRESRFIVGNVYIVDWYISDSDGQTPYELAKEHGMDDVADLMWARYEGKRPADIDPNGLRDLEEDKDSKKFKKAHHELNLRRLLIERAEEASIFYHMGWPLVPHILSPHQFGPKGKDHLSIEWHMNDEGEPRYKISHYDSSDLNSPYFFGFDERLDWGQGASHDEMLKVLDSYIEKFH